MSRRERTAFDREVSTERQKGKRDKSFFMLKAGRRDANHDTVRDGLRKFFVVVDTAGVGNGVFDLCVHLGADRWMWTEVKVPGGELTADERKWKAKLERAGARTCVIHDVEEGLLEYARAGGERVGRLPAERRETKRDVAAILHDTLAQAALHVKSYTVRRPAPARGSRSFADHALIYGRPAVYRPGGK